MKGSHRLAVAALLLVVLAAACAHSGGARELPAASASSVGPPASLSTGPARLVRFTDQRLGLTFAYPGEWGTVTVSGEDPVCAASGEGNVLRFSGKATAGGTMRSKDYVAAASCGRAGAYFDSPPRYSDLANLSDKAWDPVRMDGFKTLDRSTDRRIDAQCSAIINFAGLDGWVRLGGQKFDVIHFYQQLREPPPGGGGVDLTGCEDMAALFAPVAADFTAMVKSAGSA